MEVTFRFKNGARTGYHKFGKHGLTISKGLYKTPNKDIIESIISSDLYKRGEVMLASDAKAVNRYLSGEEVDRLTKDFINTLPDDCIKELAVLANTKERNMTRIIAAELNGMYITDAMNEAIARYERKEVATDILQDALKEGIVKKSGQGKKWYVFPEEWEVQNTTDEAVASQTVSDKWRR